MYEASPGSKLTKSIEILQSLRSFRMTIYGGLLISEKQLAHQFNQDSEDFLESRRVMV
jgi:hypothetical protein